MIRGRFDTQGAGINRIKRPVITARLVLPGPPHPLFAVTFIVDTGADTTLLSTADGVRLQAICRVNLSALQPQQTGGVGGGLIVRIIQNASLEVGTSPAIPIPVLSIADPSPGNHQLDFSLFGRDAMRDFMLIHEEHTNKIRLLDRNEVSQLRLNGRPVP